MTSGAPALVLRFDTINEELCLVVQLHPDTPGLPCETTTHHTEDARITALVTYEPDCCAPNSVTLFGLDALFADYSAQRAIGDHP